MFRHKEIEVAVREQISCGLVNNNNIIAIRGSVFAVILLVTLLCCSLQAGSHKGCGISGKLAADESASTCLMKHEDAWMALFSVYITFAHEHSFLVGEK